MCIALGRYQVVDVGLLVEVREGLLFLQTESSVIKFGEELREGLSREKALAEIDSGWIGKHF